MPSSTRKSNIGAARRSIQKAHIPYRGDNPEVGKKTGIAVGHVERMSDGFEPFDQVIQQADKRTPPRPKKRKKSAPAVQQPEFDDENGEMSMDIDETPVRYLSNARIPSTPTLRNTSGSSRPVARSSEVSFDDIPSPRPRTSSSHTANAGPSSLSKTFTSGELGLDSNSESDSDNEPADYGDHDNNFDVSGAADMNGDFGSQSPTPQRSSPRRKSFAQIDQDLDGQEEDEDQQEEDQQSEQQEDSPPRIDKGKRKARLEDIEEEEAQIEDEIAQGLHDFENEQSEEEQAPSPPPKKKQRVVEEQEKQKKPKPSKSKKENREPSREGVRRSTRERFKPLEWWRGEKVVYGRTASSGPVLVPTIKEIRRIPTEQPEPFNHKRRGYNRGRSKTADEKLAKAVYNPEEGWDDATDPFGEVHDLDKQALVVRRLVWTSKRVSLVKAANSEWFFEKVFGDSDFVAAGQLEIPPDCRKPTKATKDNTYIFYVIEGAVNFKVHEVSKVVATGGMFIAPRGNTYFIENISTRAAKLFFTQARKVPKDEMEPSGSAAPQRREKKKSLEEVRSSSPGNRSSATVGGGRAAQSLPPQASKARQQSKAGKRAPSAKV
ncbi:hypothetical protein D9756_001215 [Leucocoprinus leucothites]|uniref:CENP-C homolog n=1 Tax=Leucocoprinus leucothites TaxID=201217 RepID=A0A8H5G4M7_9AGAR|nr:hypothetical protein D9756_001215 [Leucoagaricus leucothites]